MWTGLHSQPTPEPQPPGTFHLDIPQDVVDKLAPHDPASFTQPMATLIAALIALCAAGIAWWSVNRQIKANAANVITQVGASETNLKDQLKAQDKLHRDSLAADERKQDRTERLEALFEAVAALRDASNRVRLLVISGFVPRGNHENPADNLGRAFDHAWDLIEAYSIAVARCDVAWVRLSLLDLEGSLAAFIAARKAIVAIVDGYTAEGAAELIKTLDATVDVAVAVFKNDISKLSQPE